MMSNKSPKSNHPKLKWWQKGALVALIMVFLYLLLVWMGGRCLRTRGDIDLCPSVMLALFLSPLFYLLVVYLIVCLFVFLAIKFRGTTRIILIAIAAILIIMGIYYSFHYQIEKAIYKINPEIGTRLMVEYCKKNKLSKTRDNCYLIGVRNLSLKDFSICEKIERSYSRDECYKIIGTSLGDIAIGIAYKCEQISNECERNQCFIDVLREHESFRLLKGEDICQKVIAKEVSECMANTIIGGNYQDYCYSILKGATVNIRNCKEMENIWPSYSRDRCYWDSAIVEDDPIFCGKMESEFKFSCYSRFDDISICKKLSDLSEKYKCYIEYSVLHQYSPTCEEIKSQLRTDLDNCYLDVAKQWSGINFSFCEKIKSQDKKDECYLYLIDKVIGWNNPKFCEEINPQDKKDVCYFKIAVRRKNSEFCGKIESQIVKDKCFKLIK